MVLRGDVRRKFFIFTFIFLGFFACIFIGKITGLVTWPDSPEIPELPSDEGNCIVDCEDKVCGDDGCGGNCGGCEGNEECLEGICKEIVVMECAPGEIIACESVKRGVVEGYFNRCNAEGKWANESNCEFTSCLEGYAKNFDKCVPVNYKKKLNKSNLELTKVSKRVTLKDKNTEDDLISFESDSFLEIPDNVSIKRSSLEEKREYIIVQNLSLGVGETKSIFLERKNLSSNGVCFYDAEVDNSTEILSSCTKLKCPSELGNYKCEINEDNVFVISGLTHSGVIEDVIYCGDSFCDGTETCSSCSADCGACPSAPSGGSSGGGGGGSSGGGSSRSSNIQQTVSSEIENKSNENIVVEKDLVKDESGGKIVEDVGVNSNFLWRLFSILSFAMGIILVLIFIRYIKKKKKKGLILRDASKLKSVVRLSGSDLGKIGKNVESSVLPKKEEIKEEIKENIKVELKKELSDELKKDLEKEAEKNVKRESAKENGKLEKKTEKGLIRKLKSLTKKEVKKETREVVEKTQEELENKLKEQNELNLKIKNLILDKIKEGLGNIQMGNLEIAREIYLFLINNYNKEIIGDKLLYKRVISFYEEIVKSS